MNDRTTWIWGRHPVLEALRAGTVKQVLIAKGRAPADVLTQVRETAQRLKIPVRDATPEELSRLTNSGNAQGVAAQIDRRELSTVHDVLQRAEDEEEAPFLLVLDQVQDPQNVGSLLRTASAAGVTGVVVSERRSAPISGTVVKVAAGAVDHLTIASAPNLARALEDIRKSNIWTIGLDGSASRSLFEVDLKLPSALIVGGEAQGLRRLTRELCDVLVHLPMPGWAESLNVAVAGSVAMYEVVRQRKSGRM